MAKDLEGCDGLAKTTAAPAAGMTRRALMLMRGHASNGFKQKECEQALTHCRSMTKNIQFSNNAWLALDAWLVKGVVYNFGCKFTKINKNDPTNRIKNEQFDRYVNNFICLLSFDGKNQCKPIVIHRFLGETPAQVDPEPATLQACGSSNGTSRIETLGDFRGFYMS